MQYVCLADAFGQKVLQPSFIDPQKREWKLVKVQYPALSNMALLLLQLIWNNWQKVDFVKFGNRDQIEIGKKCVNKSFGFGWKRNKK